MNWVTWFIFAFGIGLAMSGVIRLSRHGLYLRLARLVEHLLELSKLVANRIEILPERIELDKRSPWLLVLEEEAVWFRYTGKYVEEEAAKTKALPRSKWFWFEKDIGSIENTGMEIGRMTGEIGIDTERLAGIEGKNKELIDERGKFKGLLQHGEIEKLDKNLRWKIKKIILKGKNFRWFVDDEGDKWSFDDAGFKEFKKAKGETLRLIPEPIVPDDVPLVIEDMKEKSYRITEVAAWLPDSARRLRDSATNEVAWAAAFFALGSLTVGLFALLRAS